MTIYAFSPLLTSPTDVGVIGDDQFHVNVGSYARTRHEWGTYRVLGARDSLADVTATDTLYVYAHGDYRTQLFYTKVGDRKALSPGQLAVILQERGLKDHANFVVHLFACTTGVVGEDGRTMAHRVAVTLHRLGYRQLRVGGYVGFVSAGDGRTFQTSKRFGGNLREATGEATDTKAATSRLVVYNLNGTIYSGHEGRGIETQRGNETHFRIRNI